MVIRSNIPKNPALHLMAGFVLLVAVACVLVFVGQRNAAQAKWPVTTAQVTETGWLSYRNSSYRGKNLELGSNKRYRYIPTIKYAYTVNGMTYTGKREFRSHNVNGSRGLSAARDIRTRYPVGMNVSIRYDPKNPGQSVSVK